MKKLLKIMSLFLVIVFVLGACQSSAPEIVPEYNTNVESADLGGVSFVWGWQTSEDVNLGFVNGTAHSDMALERKKTIEESMNCTVNMEYSSDVYTTLRSSVMSGSPYFDILTAESFSLANDIRSGYMTGLSTYLDVTNTDKWGTPNILQHVIWKDDVFAVVPYAWPELMYGTIMDLIAVNEDIVARLGLTDPREYVENKTWVWEQFEECLTQYTHEYNGRKVYGMAVHDADIAMMMFLSNGNKLSTFVDGEVVCGAYTNSGYVALERARMIYNETYKDCIHPDDPLNYVGVEHFVNGDIVMLTITGKELFATSRSLLYVAGNVGILPYPQGPNAVLGEYPSYHSNLLYITGIPVNAKEVEGSAAVLDAMFEPFDEYKTKEDIISYMAEQIFFDERDAKVVANMLEHTEYNFFLEGARAVIQSVVEQDKSITSLLDSYEDQYEKIVADYMVHHYEGIVSVYGE